jgi:hypothetical protein
MRNVVLVQIAESGKQLLHNHRCFSFCEVLSVKNEVKKFTTVAVSIELER